MRAKGMVTICALSRSTARTAPAVRSKGAKLTLGPAAVGVDVDDPYRHGCARRRPELLDRALGRRRGRRLSVDPMAAFAREQSAATSAAEATACAGSRRRVARREAASRSPRRHHSQPPDVAQLPQQRNQLVLIDGSDQDSRGDGAESEVRGSGMSQQRRGLRLVGHPDIAAGRANSNAAVAPRHVANQVAEWLRHIRRGMLLQPKLYILR